MSGDVQPRKRKDKKKKKDDDPIPEKLHVPIFTNNTVTDDVNIHVHKEGGTGGGICAKLVFFILFSALAVLIGLIITEHRGLTDIETVDPNSKFSQLFEGWVDANVESHDDHDIEEHGSIEDDDHEDHDDQDDDEDHNDNHSEEVDENEHEDEDDEDENNNQLDENLDDEDEENEQEDEDDEDDGINEIDDEEEDDEDDLDYYTQTKKTAASEEEEQDEDAEQEQDDEDEQDNNDSQAVEEPDQDEEDQDEDEEYDKSQEVSREKRDISEEKLDGQQDDDVDNNADDQNIDEDDNDETNDTKDDEADDTFDEAKDVDDEDSSEKETKEKQTRKDQQDDIIEKEEEDNDEKLEKTGTEPEDELKDDAAESSSMAVKLGVGVALLVVAHLVLVKKWRTAPDESDTTEPTSVPNLQDRRNTIIVPPSFKEVEPDIEQVQEDYSEEEEDLEEDEKVETNVAKTKYQEIATAYIRPTPADKKFDTGRSTKTYEYEDDEEIDDENEQEDEELEEEEEEDEAESDVGDGEEYDDEEVDDEDEELLKRLEARYGKLHKDNAHKTAESRESDSDKQSDDDDYDYTNITNEDDYRIRKEIDEAQGSIKNNNALAVALFDKILQNFPSSPRSLYGKALALDDLAERKRSNDILEQALQLYEKVLKIEKVPSTLFNIVADRYINRLRFLGQYRKSITVHKIIIDKFPNNPKHLNSLGVTYLTMNRVEEARSIFKQVLTKWPENGFALVHYGFILKTTDKALKKSIRYLEKGIRTKDEGVIDGRFYFHLGDALARLGRNNDAVKVYEEGTKNKVFLSKYQRSLYNVPRLSSKPWWSSKDLPYTNSLRLLSESWKKIKEEGLTILSESGYFQDESENLKDTGDWKQFELYARGQKNVKNCKKCPFTCNIIDQIPEAKSCRRGQTKFSVMHPGTHVWPHCGPTNCRVRIHLGLKVPLNTFIRVAENTKSWKEGELLVFDDSFEHEVWHNGSEFRLILIVDVWHPELTPSERFNLSPI